MGQRGEITYGKQITSSVHATSGKHVQRLVEVVLGLNDLVHDLELQHGSRIVDGRVQIDLAILGSLLKEILDDEPTFQCSHDALAELFRWREDQRPEIRHPRWDGQQRYVFVLGEGTVHEALKATVLAAIHYSLGVLRQSHAADAARGTELFLSSKTIEW